MKRNRELKTGRGMPNKRIRARYSHGALIPLEPVELAEGAEILVTLSGARPLTRADWITRTAGGWAGLVDGEKLKQDIYQSRSAPSRPEPRL